MRDKILSILAHHGVMALATNRPDGWPQATAVSYINQGLTLYCLVSRTSQIFANIGADDRIAISIASGSPDPVHFEGLSMSARAVEARDEPYRSDILALMRSGHPAYFDTPSLDMSRSALIRALPQVISIIDFSKGLGHTDLVTVGVDQALELTAARPDDWGPDPAELSLGALSTGAAARDD